MVFLKSTVKTRSTIPKAARFANNKFIENPGPGEYSPKNPLFFKNNTSSIGISNKSTILIKSSLDIPGPGTYALVDLKQIKPNINSGKFSHIGHLQKIWENNKNPAPGSYCPTNDSFIGKSFNKKLFFSAFGSGPQRETFRNKFTKNVGPGSYHITNSLIVEKKMDFGGKINDNNAAKYKKKYLAKLPGPGAYFINVKKECRNCVFGKEERKSFFDKDQNIEFDIYKYQRKKKEL